MASFKLASKDSEFNSRVDKLFDSLAAVSTELKLDSIDSVQSADEVAVGIKRNIKNLNSDNDDDDDDANFLKPMPVPQKKKSKAFNQAQILRIERFEKDVPGYVKDPNQWKCYSLQETKCPSDSENAAIASQLLTSLQESSSLPYIETQDVDLNNPITKNIIFKKPVKLSEESSSDTTSENVKSQKHFIKPSYEFGHTKSKNKKASKSSSSSPMKNKKLPQEISLSYLLEEESVED